MAKVIRFPLIVADDYPARSLEELRKYFSLEKVLEYYHKDHRLLTWLDHRGLEDEAEAIRALDDSAADFQLRICEIFQVEYTGTVDEKEIKKQMERRKILKELTDEPEFHKNVGLIAFNQEELAELVIDEGETKVYLCQKEGEDFTFTIPGSRKGVTYIGIPCKDRKPRVRVSGNALDRLDELEIQIQSCEVEEQKQQETDEAEERTDGLLEKFFDTLFQEEQSKPGTGSVRKVVNVRIRGTQGLPVEKAIEGNEKEIREGIALLVQEVLAGQAFVSEIELTAASGSIPECRIKPQPDAISMTRVKGVHIDRGSDGSRHIYIDLVHPVKLNHRKYRTIPILSVGVYEKLDLLEGSEIEVYCFENLIPAVRVDERGMGRTLRCPHCGSRFTVRDGAIFCENPVCFDRLHGRIFRLLEAIGLKEYDQTFVQSLLTKLPVKALKDVFEIDTDMIERHGITDEKFKSFPDDLRKAISDTADYIILGKMGIPDLGVKRAGFLTKKCRAAASYKNMELWNYLYSEFSDKDVEDSLGNGDISDNIQRWLWCDRRSMKVFRDDIFAVYQYICNVGDEPRSREELELREIRDILTPGAYVGIGNIADEEVEKIFQKERFQYARYRKEGWSIMKALIVGAEKSNNSMVIYAREHSIPIFTLHEFRRAFEK